MKRQIAKLKEEARRLYLTGEESSNAEIAARLKVKPHTVGRWRREEDWEMLRVKLDRRAAEQLVAKLATDRVSLNVRHFRLWEVVLTKLLQDLKSAERFDIRQAERAAGILERAQRGQRLAKGLSVAGETEESLRAEFQASLRGLVDTFIKTIKENIGDEETRDKIRRTILEALPEEEGDGAGPAGDEVLL